MEVLEKRVKQRREIFNFYRSQLQHIEACFLPEPKACFSNRWLTTVLLPGQATTPNMCGWRWKRKTLKRGRSGSRCTCNRCSKFPYYRQ